MRRLLTGALVLLAAALAAGWWLSAPVRIEGDPFAGLTPDLARGKEVFDAAGCAGCHAAPGAKGDARLVLAGGEAFPSAFGTFYAPNISPSPQGIGGWSAKDLMGALVNGVAKNGRHLYPVLPYSTYDMMTPGDVLSLDAYLRTLPPSDAVSKPQQARFPFSIRRGIGLWKLLFLDRNWVMTDPATPEIEKGRYLVEALGHCGQCHTPRGSFGQMELSHWLEGAPNPVGKGKVPGLVPDKLDWSAGDIASFLATGLKPNYDTAGGMMYDVIDNWSKLPDADRQAAAAYLKALK